MEKSQITYKVEIAAHVNLANVGADCSEISYAGGNCGCCDNSSVVVLTRALIGNRGDDLRTEQSRSAMPRTSTSQQLGVPVAQTAVAA